VESGNQSMCRELLAAQTADQLKVSYLGNFKPSTPKNRIIYFNVFKIPIFNRLKSIRVYFNFWLFKFYFGKAILTKYFH